MQERSLSQSQSSLNTKEELHTTARLGSNQIYDDQLGLTQPLDDRQLVSTQDKNKDSSNKLASNLTKVEVVETETQEKHVSKPKAG